AAVVIARGDGSSQIARDATVHAAAESVISSLTTLQADVRETLVIGDAAGAGLAGAGEIRDVVSNLRSSIEEAEIRVTTLLTIWPDAALERSAEVMATEARSLADTVEAGDIRGAVQIADAALADAYIALLDRAVDIRDSRARNIAAVQEGLDTVATAARVLSGLLIPALSVLVFYRIMRRRQREALLEGELKREKELRRKKDAFIAAASHHINTPLAAVVGFAELLRDRTRDFSAGVRNEVTELLAIQAQETSHVVDDLLAAARLDLGDLALRYEELDVRQVIDEATDGWASEQRARITISGNGVTSADRKWFGHALRNLLRNAVGFGGENIWVRVAEPFNKVVVEVADDGPGIPPQESKRIFELYYSYRQVEGLAPSLGLGLSVARKLALAMGGDIHYERDEGENVFTLSLPRSTDRAAPPILIPDRTVDPSLERPSPESIKAVAFAGGPQMVYQPIIDMRARAVGETRIVGYEAHARFPFLTATQWFEAAAAEGLRLDLELACIKSAVRGFSLADESPFLSINVSDGTLLNSRLLDALIGFDPGRVVLELSEAASIKSYEATRSVVESLATRGMRLAVDDVGSGEIDLWHIARLGASLVKIDLTLVHEIETNPRNRALIRGISAMAHDLGIMVVAAGIEREEEHEQLLELDIQFGQGWLYGKPAPLSSRGRVLTGGYGTDDASLT
ncbi:MAG: EAL domain-containing protein, partial [Acidimicrobiia bacterium]